MIVQVIVWLVVVGVVLWAVNVYLPMETTMKRILNVVVILATVLWLLKVFGLLAGGPVRVG